MPYSNRMRYRLALWRFRSRHRADFYRRYRVRYGNTAMRHRRRTAYNAYRRQLRRGTVRRIGR